MSTFVSASARVTPVPTPVAQRFPVEELLHNAYKAASVAAIIFQSDAVQWDKRPAFYPDGIGADFEPGALKFYGHPASPASPTALFFDASIREEHSIENQLTDNPIEDGGSLTDHIRTMPRVLTMEVVITPTKDRIVNPGELATGSHPAINPNASGVAGDPTWRTLVELAKARKPFDVATSLALYTDMVIVRMSTPRTNETSNALYLSIQLRKIEISRTTSLMTAAAAELAEIAWDLGQQATEAANGPAELDPEVGQGVLPSVTPLSL